MQGKLKDSGGGILLTMKTNNRYLIGRDQAPGGNCLNLEDPYVSRRHGFITCEKGFFYEDAGSKNGSRINDESLPAGEKAFLKDGDRITVGQTELVFCARKGKPAVRMAQGVRVRLSENSGGARVLVQAPGKEPLEYARRMLEKNPDPALPIPVRSDTAEGECMEYLIRDSVSLKEYFRQERTSEETRTLLEKMFRSILSSESLLLDEAGFLMSPDTVFVSGSGEIRLIFLPYAKLSREDFNQGLLQVFAFLEKRSPLDFRKVLDRCAEQIREGGECWDCYKILHCTGDVDIKKSAPAPPKDLKKANVRINAGTVLMILSFLVFMAIFWFADLSATNLAGAALILAGFNVLAAGLRTGNRSTSGKHCLKKEKTGPRFAGGTVKKWITLKK